MFCRSKSNAMLDSVVLKLIHYVVALGVFFRQWILRIPILGYSKTDSSSIQSDARQFKKLPLHLGLIFHEDVSYCDVANAVLWSAAMGISYISLYDINGALKRNHKILHDAIEKNKSYQTDHEQSKMDFHIHSKLEKKEKGNCANHIDVFLLSLADGRQSLVQTAQTLCRRVSTNQLAVTDISPQSLDSFIQDETGYPDPDLLIRFGGADSLLGFMPWHIRLTEILSFSSHWGLDYKSFKSLFVSYGNTQQRFGK